jgi:hypothetical protein
MAVILIGFIIVEKSFAAPCYGTDMPSKGKWLKAFETNIVFKRKLDKSYGRVKSKQYFLDLSYGVSDWLVFDFKLGVGSFKHKPTSSYEIDYDTHFAGGYGFRIRVFDDPDKNLKGVLGFQHISLHPPIKKINGDKNEAILDDWQISTLLSKDFRIFTPYLGAKLSRCDVIHKLNGDRKRRKSSEPFVGLVAGTDIKLGKSLKLNIEGRAIDETALSSRLSFLF